MGSRPWHLRRAIPPGPAPWASLQKAFGLSQEAARLAWMRGEDTQEALAWRMDPDWSRTHDPFLLAGMAQAVTRIKQALEQGERIVVYGDYDADGVTATALLVRVLEKMGGRPEFFIPNRFNDGYGLHLDCIRELCERSGPGLFISVDCGVRSVEEVAASAALGVAWIITDHHALGPVLPAAAAVLHPALGEHPNRTLAGVGVAFKLGQALLDAVPFPKQSDIPFLDGLLKLVALGSVADMVPLIGENALLVKRGLRALGTANGPGILALFKAARIEGVPRASEIAFGVAPRLNAVGRMGGAEDAVRLLLTRDSAEAQRLGEQVESLNQSRKTVQEDLLYSLPPPDGEAFDLVIQEGAHKGVLGIVAARRMRESGRPTGVGTLQEGVTHCSLRAPEGFDLTELVATIQPFIRSGGGHRAAAGISFEVSRLPFVRQALIRGAQTQAQARTVPGLAADGFGTQDIPAAEELVALEPFGQGFPEPLVIVEGRLSEPSTAFGQGHRKFRLEGIKSGFTWFFAEDQATQLEIGRDLTFAVSPQDQARWGRSWRVDGLVDREDTP